MCEKTFSEVTNYHCEEVKRMLKEAKEWRAEQKKRGVYKRKSWREYYIKVKQSPSSTHPSSE